MQFAVFEDPNLDADVTVMAQLAYGKPMDRWGR
jgi:hypothetical protein